MYEIRDETALEGIAAKIEQNLLASLQDGQAQALNSNVTLTMRDKDGHLIAGLVGSTSYGWLLIKIIWVHDNHRRQGHGRALIQRVEKVAKERGCHALWLDTSSVSSFEFYQSLGFECFGILANDADQNPPDHKRWFLKRPIAD